MFPVVGALGASLIVGGAQAAIGGIQRWGANRRRKKALSEMDYDIPSSTEEQLQLARERASQNGLPGEDITRARVDSDMASTTEKAEGVAETPGDILGMYQKMQGNRMDLNREILEKGAQYKSEKELQLLKSMGMMAEAEKDQFYYNRFAPFLSEMGYAGEQAQGGSANVAGGLQTAYQGWMNKFLMDQSTPDPSTGWDPEAMKQKNTLTEFTTPEVEAPMEVDSWMTNENTWGSVGNQPDPIRPPRYGTNYPAY